MDAAVSHLLDLPGLGLKTADILPAPGSRARRLMLLPGKLHEWHLAGDLPEGKAWYPPLTPMAALARQQMAVGRGERCMAWIGRRCWPSFQLLLALGVRLEACLFLDPLTEGERFWAVGQALACPAVGAVIADAEGMSYLVSRRLQLAAESAGRGSAGVLAFLARPPWEAEGASCAATRWEVQPRRTVQQGTHLEWSMRLLSCRGQQREQDAASFYCGNWTYQVARGTGTFDLSAGVEHRAGVSANGVGACRDGSAQARALPA